MLNARYPILRKKKLKMSFDARGVRRGRCTVCRCDVYDGGEAGMKCVRCGHPPGKHQNSSIRQHEGIISVVFFYEYGRGNQTIFCRL